MSDPVVFLEGANRPLSFFIGRRLWDDMTEDYGTIVGVHGKRWHVEWDRGTPHPSYIPPARVNDGWWRLVPETDANKRDRYRRWVSQ